MAFGVLARATLVSAVYKQTLAMTVTSRARHPNGQLTTLISSDVSTVRQIRLTVDLEDRLLCTV